MSNNLGPGRKTIRYYMHLKGHAGSKRLTKGRLKAAEGKRIFKGCFGYTL